MKVVISLVVPVRTMTEANAKEHWRTKHARAKAQRNAVAYALLRGRLLGIANRPSLPCRVRLTRIGKGKMDSDNVIGSLKHIRDAVAEWFGVGDGPDSPLQFDYGTQERGAYAVRIEVLEYE